MEALTKIQIQELKKRIEPIKQLALHDDADGISSAVLMSYIFKINKVWSPDDFGEWPVKPYKVPGKEELEIPPDVCVDMVPQNPSWSGLAVDHHPGHPPEDKRAYQLIHGDAPTSIIIYTLFKELIPKEQRWKCAVGCVHGNTKISTPKGAVSARKVKIGDKLWAWTGNGFAETTVVAIDKHRDDTLWELIFKHKKMKRRLLITGEHPILEANGKWTPVSELQIGTEVRFFDSGTYQRVMGITEKNSQILKEIFKDPRKRHIREALVKRQPSRLEKRLIEIIEREHLPIKWVGNGQLETQAGYFPDFQVIGQPHKIIEVSRSHYKDESHLEKKLKTYEEEGFQCLLLFMTPQLPRDEQLASMLWNFVSNGMILVSKRQIKAKLSSKHVQKFQVYNYHCEPYNNYIAQSIVVHNCVGDGVPELIPAEIWKEFPILLEECVVTWERYGKIETTNYPLYLRLSSGINAACKLPEKWYIAYSTLRNAKSPWDLIKDSSLKSAKGFMDEERRKVLRETTPIQLRNGIRLWGFSSETKIERTVAWEMWDRDKRTVVAVNLKTGRGSIRGTLATLLYEHLSQHGFRASGHPGFGGLKLKPNQSFEELYSCLASLKI